MSSIGETLRRERRRRNLELDQISRELKIPSRFLEAIEDECFERLPAGVFAKNFVRQYADLMELDGEAFAAEVQRALTPEPPASAEGAPPAPAQPEIPLPRMKAWETIGEGRGWYSLLPALALMVVVMVVCSGVYAFWQHTRRSVAAQSAGEPVATAQPPAAPAPAEAPPAAAPAPSAAAEAAPKQPAPAPAAAPVVPAPAKVASAQAPAGAPQGATGAGEPNSADRPVPENHGSAAAPPPADPSNPPSTTANPPAAAGPVHIELSAQEPVWVMARADGKYLFSGTIDANQTRSLDATGTLTLRVGNAGGMTITLNGKPIGAIGPKGQVRDIQFTSGGFQIVAAPKPSPPPPPPGDPR